MPPRMRTANVESAQWGPTGVARHDRSDPAQRQRLRRQRLLADRAAPAAAEGDLQAAPADARARRRARPRARRPVAPAMKEWAMEKGATHFTHWFQPLTGRRPRSTIPSTRRPATATRLPSSPARSHPGRARRLFVPTAASARPSRPAATPPGIRPRRGGGRRDPPGGHPVQRPGQRPRPGTLRSGAEPCRREPGRTRRARAFLRLWMALTREDPRSWISDSTRGVALPVSEIWNPGPRVLSAPDDVREVCFTVQVEIRSIDINAHTNTSLLINSSFENSTTAVQVSAAP